MYVTLPLTERSQSRPSTVSGFNKHIAFADRLEADSMVSFYLVRPVITIDLSPEFELQSGLCLSGRLALRSHRFNKS
jgi:hypothetical protein